MARPIDQNVISLLEQTKFSRHELDGVLSYYNEAQSTRQGAKLYFVSRYATPEAAHQAEILMDIYLRAIEKGTPNYPTKDSLERAFRSARTTIPDLYTNRILNQLMFVVSLSFPSGEIAKRSLEHILSVINEVLTSPRVRTPDEGAEVMEEARGEVINSIKDRAQNHSARASSLFLQRYFPNILPFGDETEEEIVRQASVNELAETFDKQLAESFPVLLFSGDTPFESIADSLIPFVASYAGKGNGSVLTMPQPLVFPEVGAPVFEYGPSDQMQFLRAYPLTSIPEKEDEKAELGVVNYILGGSWTGQLMQIVREKHHLVYSIKSSYGKSKNMIRVSTEHNPAFYSRIEGLTREIVEDIASGNFTDEQFAKAQDELLEGVLISPGRSLITCNQPGFRLDRAYSQFIAKTTKLSPVEEYLLMASLEPCSARQTVQRYLNPNISQIFTYSKEGGKNGNI